MLGVGQIVPGESAQNESPDVFERDPDNRRGDDER